MVCIGTSSKAHLIIVIGIIEGSNFVPPKEKIVSIVLFPDISRHAHLLDFQPIALFGDKKMTETLFGKTLEPKMIFEGRDKMEKIVDEYNSALKEGKILSDQYYLIFVTPDWFYWKIIYLDANTVYDRYIASKPLKTYFDELGITKELLANQSAIAESNDTNTIPAGP